MSKRCPDCGFLNEDSRIYCSSCGELLDPELRLIKDLDSHTSGAKRTASTTTLPREDPAPAKKASDDDYDYTPPKTAQKKSSSPLPWIILGVVAVVVVIALIALS